MSDYAQILDRIEALLDTIPVDQLRQDVMFAESMIGKFDSTKPRLPSGLLFDSHTVRARLWLDFIDELKKQRAEAEVAA